MPGISEGPDTAQLDVGTLLRETKMEPAAFEGLPHADVQASLVAIFDQQNRGRAEKNKNVIPGHPRK